MSNNTELTPVKPQDLTRKRQKKTLSTPDFNPVATADPLSLIDTETLAVTESNRIRGYNVAVGMGSAANAGFIEGVQQGMVEVQASQALVFSEIVGRISTALL